MTGPLATGYLSDPDLHAAANGRDENYRDVFLAGIAEPMGLPVQRVSLAALGDARTPAQYSAPTLGEAPADRLVPLTGALERWVRAGGVPVGMGRAGLDELFGVRCRGTMPQPAGPFSQTAAFALHRHELTAALGSPLQPEQRLLVFAPGREVRCVEADELGRLLTPDGGARGLAAVTVRPLGAGLALYFSFSAAQTVWVVHKGQPALGDRDGDGYLRVSDLIAIGTNSQLVQYADELVWLIRDALAHTGQHFDGAGRAAHPEARPTWLQRMPSIHDRSRAQPDDGGVGRSGQRSGRQGHALAKLRLSGRGPAGHAGGANEGGEGRPAPPGGEFRPTAPAGGLSRVSAHRHPGARRSGGLDRAGPRAAAGAGLPPRRVTTRRPGERPMT